LTFPKGTSRNDQIGAPLLLSFQRVSLPCERIELLLELPVPPPQLVKVIARPPGLILAPSLRTTCAWRIIHGDRTRWDDIGGTGHEEEQQRE